MVRAVEKLREHFDKPLRIESIARELGMSASGFHAHFKAVTAMSPLQFQKHLRLQEARRLMLSENLDAARGRLPRRLRRRLALQPRVQAALRRTADARRRTTARTIGSLRRECLDLVIVLDERHLRRPLPHLRRVLNVTRPHQSLGKDSPRRRTVRPLSSGHIVAVPEVGGLHHRYQRAA